jgi:hypothetical protein
VISKGEEAEELVQRLLESLPKKTYTAIPKVIITLKDDSSQIDHILVSKYGIFIIETKSNSGNIIGDTFSSAWTQLLGSNRRIFQSPVRQNWAHVKAVQSLFPERDDEQFIPLVVFVGDAQLEITNNVNPVVKEDRLLNVIKAHSSVRIDEDDIDYIINRIMYFKLKNKDQMDNHIKVIHAKLSKRREQVYKNICPVCGKFLTIQIDSYGHFLGCSKYPECDFIVTS